MSVQKIRIQHVLAGNFLRQNLVVRFTVTGMFIPPYRVYMLLSTDKFGTTRVLNWDTGPSLCASNAPSSDDEWLLAVIAEAKSSAVCATKH